MHVAVALSFGISCAFIQQELQRQRQVALCSPHRRLHSRILTPFSQPIAIFHHPLFVPHQKMAVSQVLKACHCQTCAVAVLFCSYRFFSCIRVTPLHVRLLQARFASWPQYLPGRHTFALLLIVNLFPPVRPPAVVVPDDVNFLTPFSSSSPSLPSSCHPLIYLKLLAASQFLVRCRLAPPFPSRFAQVEPAYGSETYITCTSRLDTRCAATFSSFFCKRL